jgi:predicted restriction endonuclease
VVLDQRALDVKYGSVCAITGPAPRAALEAAHLRAFAVHGTHEVNEGLLLRADIHGLFDVGLVAVHPDTHEVHVSPELDGFAGYRALRGRRLQVDPPVRAALQDHFDAATAGWL